MLDRFALEKELKKALLTQENWLATTASQIKKAWESISEKKITDINTKPKKSLAQWDKTIGETSVISTEKKIYYHAYAIDGSQIYPDRHTGNNLALINVGYAGFWYKQTSSADLQNRPIVYTEHNLPIALQGSISSEGFIDALRSAHEFEEAVTLSSQKNPDIILFDGSLIFWHLGTPNQPAPHAKYFAQRYLDNLGALAKTKTPYCSYISNPKSRDLIDILAYFKPECANLLTGYTDADLLSSWLKKNNRTPLFKSNAPIIQIYPEPLRPYFTYLCHDNEIIRIEIPAWIAENDTSTEKIITLTLDQIIKGHGYPITLAEAHEQAVIKEYDRQFILERISKTKKTWFSQKQRLKQQPLI